MLSLFGLKCKMYSYIGKDNEGDKKAKELYKNALFEENQMRHEMKRIQSKYLMS